MERDFINDDAIRNLTGKVAKGGGIVFIGALIGSLITIILHMILSRNLGASSYGLYALGFSIFLIVSKISLFGIPMGVLRFVAGYRGVNDVSRVKGTIISALTIVFTTSILASFFLYVGADILATHFFQKQELSWIIKVLLFALPLYNLSVVSYFAMRAFRKMLYFVFFRDIARKVINIVVVIIAFVLGFKLKGAVFAFFLSIFITTIINLNFLRLVCREILKYQVVLYEVKKLFRFSIPILFVGLSFLLLNQTSRILIGYFRYSDEVGVYNVAANLSVLIIMVLNCVDAIFAPIISELHNKNDMNSIDHLFKTSTRWVFSLSAPITLVFLLFPRELMSIFGPEFINGYKALMILAIAYLINAMTGSVSFMLQMTGNQDIELKNSVVMLVVCVGMNVFLVRHYGLIGAALATGLSISLLNILRLIEVKFLLNIQPYDRNYLKPLLAVTIAASFGIVFSLISPLRSLFWIVKIVLLFMIYFMTLISLGIEREDESILVRVKERLLGLPAVN